MEKSHTRHTNKAKEFSFHQSTLLVRGGSDDLRVRALDDQHDGASLRDGGGGIVDADAVGLVRRPVLALAEGGAVGRAPTQRALCERLAIAVGALFVFVRLGAGLQAARRLQRVHHVHRNRLRAARLKHRPRTHHLRLQLGVQHRLLLVARKLLLQLIHFLPIRLFHLVQLHLQPQEWCNVNYMSRFVTEKIQIKNLA
jgi:hypothetical protein